MATHIMSDGRPIIELNAPSKEQAVQVMFRLVKKRLEQAAKEADEKK